MKGKFPDVLQDKNAGRQAQKLFDEANALLDRIIEEKLFTANGIVGLFPANAVGDDIEGYENQKRDTVLTTFHTLRQQAEKRRGQPNEALAGYVAPSEVGRADYMGAFAVTTGHGAPELVQKLKKEHDDYTAAMTKALGDRLAEGFAESRHEQVRTRLWG